MNRLLVGVGVALASGMWVGCTNNGDDDDTSSSSGGTSSGGYQDLQGTWVKSCDVEGNGAEQHTLVVTGSSATYTIQGYEDTTCGTLSVTTRVTGTISVGGEFSGVAGAREIDTTGSGATATPASAASALALNAIQFCGLTGWQANVAKDVSGKTCADLLVLSVGQKDYDIFKIDGNRLYFGTDTPGHDGTSPDRRRNTLDPSWYYVKQGSTSSSTSTTATSNATSTTVTSSTATTSTVTSSTATSGAVISSTSHPASSGSASASTTVSSSGGTATSASGAVVSSSGSGGFEFSGGCYDITQAAVQDSCFKENAQLGPALLTLVNAARRQRGLANLTNPVNVSLMFETGLKNVLEQKYPVFPLDPINPGQFQSGSITVEIPNPYAANVDASGSVPDSAMVTVTCAVSGQVATCTIANFEVDLAELVVDQLAEGNAEITYTCTVTVSGTASITYQSSAMVLYGLDYTLVPGGNCEALIQQMLVNAGAGCQQSYDLTVELKGPVAADGGVCSAYSSN